MNPGPVSNRLIAALPRKDRYRLLAGFEPVTLRYGEVLYEAGKPIRHVYFPNDSPTSLLTLMVEHIAIGISVVGREGMLGITVALGGNNSPVRAIVVGSGAALSMTSALFRSEFKRSVALQRVMSLCIHERMVRITQTAVCHRFHQAEPRLARCLLMTRDRVGTSQFHYTQDILSSMLGVRRVAITNAARALQRRKLISYHRGNITILDEAGLEAAACQCYRASPL